VPDSRRRRIGALIAALERLHLDGVLLSDRANIQYLTGFTGSSALVVVTARDTLLITDFRYATQVADEVGDLARISIETQSLWDGVWRLLPQLGSLEVLGFESAHLTHRDFERLLSAGVQWQWRPTVDLVEALREQKDADEVARIATAAAVAERALAKTIDAVRVGMTELEVAGVLELALRQEGSEGFPFPTIVASGARSALPHARAEARAIEAGDFLLIDFGAVVGGYCSDVTRTFVVGRANDEQRALYRIVQGANAEASRGIRAGMKGRDADALARRYIEERGFGEQFGHSLGHGIGLDVHESPRLARTAESALLPDAVVTIEPGIYRPGWGGVRIEDDVVVGAGEPRILTGFTRELLELG
jgi:Xaa-Pro aminopeptidase